MQYEHSFSQVFHGTQMWLEIVDQQQKNNAFHPKSKMDNNTCDNDPNSQKYLKLWTTMVNDFFQVWHTRPFQERRALHTTHVHTSTHHMKWKKAFIRNVINCTCKSKFWHVFTSYIYNCLCLIKISMFQFSC